MSPLMPAGLNLTQRAANVERWLAKKHLASDLRREFASASLSSHTKTTELRRFRNGRLGRSVFFQDCCQITDVFTKEGGPEKPSAVQAKPYRCNLQLEPAKREKTCRGKTKTKTFQLKIINHWQCSKNTSLEFCVQKGQFIDCYFSFRTFHFIHACLSKTPSDLQKQPV